VRRPDSRAVAWFRFGDAEILHGLTAGIIGPAISAISLGIGGQRALSGRTGRNHRFQGAGNAATAVLFGLLGNYVTKSAIFLATAALTIPALIALRYVRTDEIDYVRARNAKKEEERPHLRNIPDILKNRRLLWFSCCAAVFQLADASLLPLISEQLGGAQVAGGSILMSGMVVAPQLIVAILAPWVGYFSEIFGRKAVLVGFAVPIVRAVPLAFISDPILMIFV
jgi:Major Facilitator Superfamily